jgi:hypothetical protein
VSASADTAWTARVTLLSRSRIKNRIGSPVAKVYQ